MPIAQDKKVLVQVRLPEALVKDLDHLSVEWGGYRSDTIERLLKEALEAHKESLWPSRP